MAHAFKRSAEMTLIDTAGTRAASGTPTMRMMAMARMRAKEQLAKSTASATDGRAVTARERQSNNIQRITWTAHNNSACLTIVGTRQVVEIPCCDETTTLRRQSWCPSTDVATNAVVQHEH
mmetsp:Transcript_25639/g.71648  ORF Transcript_25639/g.71648 Transcript_25639/m.71648 type:complete len:121 (-) Transcript_25639:403-765(-)